MLWLLVLICIFAYFLIHQFYLRRKGLPPGPTPLPVFGNALQMDFKKPHVHFQNLSKEYGPMFTFWLGTTPHIVITDIEGIRETLVKQGEIFSGRPPNFPMEELLGGRVGLFQNDGPLFREQRRFTLHTLRGFGMGRNVMEERINAELRDLIEVHIPDLLNGRDRGCLDIEWPLTICIGNIINLIVIGYKFDYNDSTFKRLKDLMTGFVQLFVSPKVQLLSSYPILGKLPISDHFGLDEIHKVREEFLSFFREELRKHKNTFDPNEESLDYTAAYMKEMKRREASGEPMGLFNEYQHLVSIWGLWLAGLETTVTTLYWCFLYMLHYPAVQERCRQEIQSVLSETNADTLQYSDRVLTPYVVATLNEIQRHGNIGPIGTPRSILQDIEYKGYSFKKGTSFLPAIASVSIDPEFFPDPFTFNPDRFLEPDGKSLRKCDEFTPFGLGKRSCIGESLARMELYLILANVIQHYKLSVKPGTEGPPSLEPVVGLTFHPQQYEMMMEKI